MAIFLFLFFCVPHAENSEHIIILKLKPRPVIPALRGSEKTHKLMLIPLVCSDTSVPESHLCLTSLTWNWSWGHWRQPTPLPRMALVTEEKFLLGLVIPFLENLQQGI